MFAGLQRCPTSPWMAAVLKAFPVGMQQSWALCTLPSSLLYICVKTFHPWISPFSSGLMALGLPPPALLN